MAPPYVLEIGAPANQSADSIWVRMYWCASIQIKRNIGGGSGLVGHSSTHKAMIHIFHDNRTMQMGWKSDMISSERQVSCLL